MKSHGMVSKSIVRARLLSLTLTVLSVLTLLFVVAYLCYHSLAVFDETYMTGVVKSGTADIEAELDAVLIRDDILLTADGTETGVIRNMAENGERVGFDREIVRIYTEMGYTQEQIEELEAQISENEAMLDFVESALDVGHTTYYAAGNALDISYNDLLLGLYSSDTALISKRADELLLALSRYDAVKNGKAELLALKEELLAEQKSLLGKYVGDYNSVTTEQSGYFFGLSEVDGYEDIFGTSAINGINADKLRQMLASSPSAVPHGTCGKMTASYEWRVMAIADAELCRSLEVDGDYAVTFGHNGRCVTMKLERIAAVINGEGVLIFKSDVMPEDFEYTRFSEISVKIGEYSGLSVSSSAVYGTGDDRCVYTLKKGKLVKKRAEVLYEKDGVCILSEGSEESAEGGLPYPEYNDVVIVSGKELYDGKVIE